MGKTLLTDTVASVSGDNNEILTMTTGSMTVNRYRDYVIYDSVRLLYMHIASNDADTITLDTPTTSYDSLAGTSIIVERPSDYFGKDQDGKYPEINASLKINATSGMSAEISDSDLDLMLVIIEGHIHEFIDIVGDPFTKGNRGYSTVRKVIIAMVMRWNMRRQFNKLTNQMQYVAGHMVPEFTAKEERDLLNLSGADDGFVFDKEYSSGREIYPTSYGDWTY